MAARCPPRSRCVALVSRRRASAASVRFRSRSTACPSSLAEGTTVGRPRAQQRLHRAPRPAAVGEGQRHRDRGRRSRSASRQRPPGRARAARVRRRRRREPQRVRHGRGDRHASASPSRSRHAITGSGPVMRLAEPRFRGRPLHASSARSRRPSCPSRSSCPLRTWSSSRTRPRPRDKLVALTFDDGPWPGQTDKILKILAARGRARDVLHARRAREAGARSSRSRSPRTGNLVGNHSLGHRLLTKSKPKEIKRQINGGADAIYKRHRRRARRGSARRTARSNGRVWKQVRLAHAARRAVERRHA